MTIFQFLLFFLIPVVFAGLCPSGTFYDVHFKKCFLFHEERANFFDAEETCLKRGGHLVTIDKGFANWYIYDVAREKGIHKYWIGANRLLSLNFQWTSNEKFTRQNWAYRAVESSPDLRCVGVFLEQWSIEDCSTEFSFVCEVQPNHQAVSDFWENIQEIIGEPTVDIITTYIQQEIQEDNLHSTEENTTTTFTPPVTHHIPTHTVLHRKPTTAAPVIRHPEQLTTTKPKTSKSTTTTTTEETTTVPKSTTTEATSTTSTTTERPTTELPTTVLDKVVQDETTVVLETTTETVTTAEPATEKDFTIYKIISSEMENPTTTVEMIDDMDTSTVPEITTTERTTPEPTTPFTTETVPETTSSQEDTVGNQDVAEATKVTLSNIIVVNNTKVVSNGCADGWTLFDKWCYKAFPEKVSWLESTKVCTAEKANLVSIYSKEENDFVHDLVSNDSWIGLFDENGWDWIGSHDVTAPGAQKPYENWLLRVQDLSQGCAKMLKTMLGKWYPVASEKCSNLMESKANLAGFVCKKDAHKLFYNSIITQTNPLLADWSHETPLQERNQSKQKSRFS